MNCCWFSRLAESIEPDVSEDQQLQRLAVGERLALPSAVGGRRRQQAQEVAVVAAAMRDQRRLLLAADDLDHHLEVAVGRVLLGRELDMGSLCGAVDAGQVRRTGDLGQRQHGTDLHVDR
jgi:hypothetical protein